MVLKKFSLKEFSYRQIRLASECQPKYVNSEIVAPKRARVRERKRELTYSISEEQAGLSDAAVANQQELKKIIAIKIVRTLGLWGEAVIMSR